MIRKLIYKMRKRRFCKLNRWFCADCIYHDFVFEGAIYRGNKCRYPKYREKERGMTIKLTREEAIQDLKAIKSFERYARGRLALDIAIEALKREPSEDLISREEAIEAIELVDWYHQNNNKDMVHGANDDEHQAWYKAQDIYKALEAVPTADRPRGEWIKTSEESELYCCSICEEINEYDDNFCPRCGRTFSEAEGRERDE